MIKAGRFHFYLNVDSKALKDAKEEVVRSRSESAVEDLWSFQRTVLCGHLYALATHRATNQSTQESDHDYSTYREEMIRVNATTLYAYKQFIANVELETSQ